MNSNRKTEERRKHIGVEIILGVLLIVAMIQDWKTYRISNFVILIGGIAGIIWNMSEFGFEGIVHWGIGTGIIGALLIPFSVLRMFGAGDVKLAMVISGFYGWKSTLQILFVALCIGAVISLWKMQKHHNLVCRLQVLANYIMQIKMEKRIRKYGTGSEKQLAETKIPFAIPMGLAFFSLCICKIFSHTIYSGIL